MGGWAVGRRRNRNGDMYAGAANRQPRGQDSRVLGNAVAGGGRRIAVGNLVQFGKNYPAMYAGVCAPAPSGCGIIAGQYHPGQVILAAVICGFVFAAQGACGQHAGFRFADTGYPVGQRG